MELTAKLKPAHPYIGNQMKSFASLEYRTIADATIRAEELGASDVPFKVMEVFNCNICDHEWPCTLIIECLETGERMAICLDGSKQEIASFTSPRLTNGTASSWVAAIEFEIERDLIGSKLRPH